MIIMALVPTTRDLCVLLAESIASEDDLTPEQVAAYRRLYRLDCDKSVAELVTAGEISPVSSEEVIDFIERLKHRRINTRHDLDHVSAFLRKVTVPSQKAQLREILPSVTKTEYFLNTLLGMLNADGVAASILTDRMEDETTAINQFQRGEP
jgi:hypothetical protein